jgi:uridine kinase
MVSWIGAAVQRSPLPVMAVDGPGGAGKSTFAARLSDALDGMPVVHTDDFASWNEPIEWWPRLLEDVLEPLAGGRAARFQPYNWVTRSRDSWIEIDAPRIILEGVSANRLAFSPHVAFAIWIETPRQVRLARGLERDGAQMHDQWSVWMAAEDAYIKLEAPDERSDLVVSGLASAASGSDQIEIMRRGRTQG